VFAEGFDALDGVAFHERRGGIGSTEVVVIKRALTGTVVRIVRRRYCEVWM